MRLPDSPTRWRAGVILCVYIVVMEAFRQLLLTQREMLWFDPSGWPRWRNFHGMFTQLLVLPTVAGICCRHGVQRWSQRCAKRGLSEWEWAFALIIDYFMLLDFVVCRRELGKDPQIIFHHIVTISATSMWALCSPPAATIWIVLFGVVCEAGTASVNAHLGILDREYRRPLFKLHVVIMTISNIGAVNCAVRWYETRREILSRPSALGSVLTAGAVLGLAVCRQYYVPLNFVGIPFVLAVAAGLALKRAMAGGGLAARAGGRAKRADEGEEGEDDALVGSPRKEVDV